MAKQELVFRPENHTYWLGDEQLPSVTEFTGMLADYSKVPPDVLARAAAFGTDVHTTVQYYLENDLDETTLDPALAGCLSAYQAWQKAEGAELFSAAQQVIVERPMAHRRLKYAGTPDNVFDGLAIVDLKTRAVMPKVDCIQCAAYEQLWTANGGCKKPYRHLVLELRQDGSYVQTDVTNKQAWGMFRTLMEYKQREQIIAAWKGAKL